MPRLVPSLWRRALARRTPVGTRVLLGALVLLQLLAPRGLLAATPESDATRSVMPSMSLTHDGNGTASVNTNASSSTTFTLTSVSVNDLTVNLVITVCNGALAAGSCTRAPTSVFLPSGASTTITVGFSGGTGPGTGTLTLAAKNTSGTTLASSSVSVTVAQPLPTVSAAPHLGDRRDVSQCVADCFESTLSYTTPAYTSLDVPRSVTLLYRSGRAYPHGTLTLDVTDPYATATKFRLKVKDPNGAYVTFPNDSTALYFTRNPSGPTRLVAQFPATNVPTSAALYTAEVTMFWGTAEQGTASAAVRIIIVNDLTSPLGAGVELVGLQRVFTTQGGVLVTEGSGSATFFSGTCAPSVICSFTSPAGEFSRLTTTGTGYRRVYPDSTALTFNSTGEHVATADRFGTTTQIGYGTTTTGLRAPNAITDPTGQSITFSYRYPGVLYGTWGDGTLGNIHTPAGDAPIGIDTANNVREWDELGGGYHWRMTYLGKHLLDTAIDKANATWLHSYRYGATLGSTDAPAVTLNGGATARPRVTLRNAWAQLLDSAAAGKGTSTTALAVPADARALVIGPRTDTTFLSLNRFGAPQTITAPLTPSDSIEYNSTTGLVARTISPTGVDVRYTWSADKLVKVQNVTLGTQDSIVYAPQYSLPTQVISSTSAGQWLAYDQTRTGWPLQTTRLGSSTATPTTHYADARGRDTTVVDPAGHTTRWYYAAAGLQNLDSVRAPNLQVSQVGRDGWGRVVSTRNPYGAVTSTALDILNRPAWVAGPLYNDTTRYTYDALNHVSSVTDATNQVYTYQRNALGWVTSLTHPGALGSDSTWYDVAGNPVRVRTRAGRQVALEYDLLGRVTRKTSLTGGDTITYTYDPAGRWTKARTVSSGVPVSTDSIVTDSLGRTTTERSVRPGVAAWDVVSDYSTTNAARASVSASKNGTGQYSEAFQYDALQRPSYITIQNYLSTRFTYNSDQLRDTVVYPSYYGSALRETWEYTPSHALSRRSYNVTAVHDVLDRAYRSDSLARLVERASGTNGTFQLFDYDSKGRLAYWQKKHQTPGTSCVNQGDWGYDCSGASTTLDQLVTATYDQVENPADAGTTLGAGNRLTAFTGASMTYDADGNLATKGTGTSTDTYTWDDFGQLTSITRNGTLLASFAYDGFGRRVRKWTSTGGTIHYVWDGDQIILEADGSGATQRAYSYQPGIDRLHAVTAGGQTYYASIEPATGDVNGLIRASDNAVVAQYAYSPWGELETAPQAFDSVNSLRWKGLLYDAETGLYYVRARYYDPTVRRFISEDPIGLEGGINIYAFAGGDPVNGSDPSGLDQCWIVPRVSTTAVGHPGDVGYLVLSQELYWVQQCKEMTAHQWSNPSSASASGQTTGGGTPAYTDLSTSADATRVAPPLDRTARMYRLSCQAGSIVTGWSTGAAGGRVVGAAWGAATYGEAFAEVGTVAGGVIGGLIGAEGVVTAPAGASFGASAGRVLGYGAAAIYGARKGGQIFGTLGAAAGTFAAFSCH